MVALTSIMQMTSRAGTNKKAELQPLMAIDYFVSDVPLDRYYFYHFCHWTSIQLSNSPGTSNFWVQYVLPLSHTSNAVRHAVTAVGAAHRYFVGGSDAHSVQNMQSLTKYYNKAIAQILSCMTVSSIDNLHCVSVCCLLFIAFGSILGRYAESVRHIRAGNQLLELPGLATGGKNYAITKKLKEILSTLSVEASIFMDDSIITNERQIWAAGRVKDSSNLSSRLFPHLDEAGREIRELEVQFTTIIRLRLQDASDNNQCSTPEFKGKEDSLQTNVMDVLFKDLQGRFRTWIARFDSTMKALEYEQNPYVESHQFLNVVLAQRFWSMNSYFVPKPIVDSTADFLNAAERLVNTLAKPPCFTFSLEGNLISGLSFVVRVCSDAGKRDRALSLLRSLNRREGFWDSREIANMHKVTLSFDDFESWYEKEVAGGVPGYLAELAVESKRTK